ncbi:fungal-specific transcription factor domain-containing protein [Fusarium solani]|uniref:Fungal-specific transcription factor domain-containing protein n=1 Tax=Fusarium solani TaxID=169388 RepID=A0A9P9HE65_FUSSL|nr:fungal-specific transcription factor domain-containing protein [Fusarium solani]KAH7254814.1 fungal-specific transcription factor domain-containing protein [Fusarium solani]
MPQTLRSPRRPRKHGKTFTGCWTCRGRKVKCDEARPRCRHCLKKGIECEGYDIRLHWLPPETGCELEPSTSEYQAKSCRSQIPFDSTGPALPWSQVEEILVVLDTLQTQHDGTQGKDGTSRFINGFGVFGSLDRAPTHTLESSSPASEPLNVHHDLATSLVPFSPEQLEIRNSIGLLSPESVSDISSLSSISTVQLSTFEYAFVNPFFNDDLGEESPSCNYSGYENPARVQEDSVRHCSANEESQTALSFSLPPQPSPELTGKERFLMHHYMNRVVHLFCALDNPKSPWKTIHLPRALQSAGEIVIQGSTSKIRGALRNALLSVSAFCLSNDKVQIQDEDARKWRKDGICYRGIAIKLLSEAIAPASFSKCRPKYKEFLATMLSMISINVMSGDTASCSLHLDAAHGLITHARTWKSKYSNKAQALHRIYFFLRTIYESTAIHSTTTCDKLCEARIAGSFCTGEPTNLLHNSPGMTPSVTSSKAWSSGDAYESIYAIPQDLLMLLNRAVELISKVTEARDTPIGTDIPPHLVEICDELEKSIMDYEAGYIDADDMSGMASSNLSIIQHMTRAFHNAVIIYFAQHIRLVGHRYLQSFVENVLDSIEAIERIKAETKILATPLYWPAFIAASEAFDVRLQTRFRSWYNQVERYGIEYIRAGRCILEQVWAEGPSRGTRVTSQWKTVVERTGSTLMLS